MDALIIVAVVLVAAGLLASVFLWLRKPESPESEYVTVAELRARLEHEQGVPEPESATEPVTATGTERTSTDTPETSETAPGTSAAPDPDRPAGSLRQPTGDSDTGGEEPAEHPAGDIGEPGDSAEPEPADEEPGARPDTDR